MSYELATNHLKNNICSFVWKIGVMKIGQYQLGVLEQTETAL